MNHHDNEPLNEADLLLDKLILRSLKAIEDSNRQIDSKTITAVTGRLKALGINRLTKSGDPALDVARRMGYDDTPDIDDDFEADWEKKKGSIAPLKFQGTIDDPTEIKVSNAEAI